MSATDENPRRPTDDLRKVLGDVAQTADVAWLSHRMGNADILDDLYALDATHEDRQTIRLGFVALLMHEMDEVKRYRDGQAKVDHG